MATYPKLRSDLKSSKTTVDGAVVYNLKDPVTGSYFRLREPEYWLIRQMDGSRSPSDLAGLLAERFGIELSADDVAQFVETIDRLFFLEGNRSDQQLSRASYRRLEQRSLIDRLLYLRLKAFNPGRFLEWLTAIYRPFHNRWWFALQGLVILVGLVLFVSHIDQFHVRLETLFNIGSIVTIVLALFILVMLHEFAHAVVCRLHGGEVREMGFLLMYFQPCFYSDLSDAWLFEKKSQRLAVTWAGPYCQFVLLAVAVIIWRISMPGNFVNELARLVVMVSWLTFLFNFNPLLKLDGYYLLADWLDIPNLRRKAFAYLGNVLKRRFLGWPVEVYAASAREERIFAAYAIGAAVYSTLLLGYLFYIAAAFLTSRLGGFGLILLFLLAFFALKGSIIGLVKGAIRHFGYMKSLLKRPLRLISYLVVFGVVFAAVLAVPFPHRVSGDVIVQPLSRFTLGLNDYGLLECRHYHGGGTPENKASFIQLTTNDMAVLEVVPLVKDGQAVVAGDTLAILTSSRVVHDLSAARAELQRLESELVLLKTPPKKEEIAEAEAAVRAARASLEQSQRDLRLAEQLAGQNAIAVEELESAKSAEAVARAEFARKESYLALLKAPPRPEEEEVLRFQIAKQEARIDFLTAQAEAQVIIAPFSGVIAARQYGEYILSLADNETVELLAPVSDFELPLVEVGQRVKVKIRSYPSRTFSGEVVRIPTGSDGDEGDFPVSVLVVNSDDLLQNGMTGFAKIEVGEASLVSLAYRKLLSNLRVEFWSWW
jgi:putative peptide zinc metalloprotease protein